MIWFLASVAPYMSIIETLSTANLFAFLADEHLFTTVLAFNVFFQLDFRFKLGVAFIANKLRTCPLLLVLVYMAIISSFRVESFATLVACEWFVTNASSQVLSQSHSFRKQSPTFRTSEILDGIRQHFHLWRANTNWPVDRRSSDFQSKLIQVSDTGIERIQFY